MTCAFSATQKDQGDIHVSHILERAAIRTGIRTGEAVLGQYGRHSAFQSESAATGGRTENGTFAPTGALADPRALHAATLLPNGKVLVTGGHDGLGSTFASAELYDPNTGLFAATGGLRSARRGHISTLLANGKVLVAGGRLPPNLFVSAELYDPGTGQFSFTGSLNQPRAFATATLLPNGKVLVAGGFSATGVYLASAELYDANTGRFSFTGSMNSIRVNHTATLLPDGRVLVAGGYDGGTNVYASAELYDPDTGRFTPTGNMTIARNLHTAVWLPAWDIRPYGKVLMSGGAALASAELYDPQTGLFTPTGSMSTPRENFTATLIPSSELRPHGKVLVAAGDTGPGASPATSFTILATAELYDPDSGRFTPAGSLSEPRNIHTATLLANGALLIAGGGHAPIAGTAASSELYSLAPTYILTDLGTLGGTRSQVSGLNNRGLLSGTAAAADGTMHASL